MGFLDFLFGRKKNVEKTEDSPLRPTDSEESQKPEKGVLSVTFDGYTREYPAFPEFSEDMEVIELKGNRIVELYTYDPRPINHLSFTKPVLMDAVYNDELSDVFIYYKGKFIGVTSFGLNLIKEAQELGRYRFQVPVTKVGMYSDKIPDLKILAPDSDVVLERRWGICGFGDFIPLDKYIYGFELPYHAMERIEEPLLPDKPFSVSWAMKPPKKGSKAKPRIACYLNNEELFDVGARDSLAYGEAEKMAMKELKVRIFRMKYPNSIGRLMILGYEE